MVVVSFSGNSIEDELDMAQLWMLLLLDLLFSSYSILSSPPALVFS